MQFDRHLLYHNPMIADPAAVAAEKGLAKYKVAIPQEGLVALRGLWICIEMLAGIMIVVMAVLAFTGFVTYLNYQFRGDIRPAVFVQEAVRMALDTPAPPATQPSSHVVNFFGKELQVDSRYIVSIRKANTQNQRRVYVSFDMTTGLPLRGWKLLRYLSSQDNTAADISLAPYGAAPLQINDIVHDITLEKTGTEKFPDHTISKVASLTSTDIFYVIDTRQGEPVIFVCNNNLCQTHWQLQADSWTAYMSIPPQQIYNWPTARMMLKRIARPL